MDIRSEFNAIFEACVQLAERKNADYGSSWTAMRSTSITDQILVKVYRIRQIEQYEMRGQLPQVSEGIESELMDIINYAAFCLLKRRMEKDSHERDDC